MSKIRLKARIHLDGRSEARVVIDRDLGLITVAAKGRRKGYTTSLEKMALLVAWDVAREEASSKKKARRAR